MKIVGTNYKLIITIVFKNIAASKAVEFLFEET